MIAIVTAVVGFSQLKQPFYWHPVCMTIGVAGFLSSGVWVSETARDMSGDERKAHFQRHGVIQLAGVVFLVVGFLAVHRNKQLHNIPHLQTVHSFFGMVTLFLMLLSLLCGVFGFRSLGLSRCLNGSQIQTVKSIHRCLGRSAVVLGCITAAHGASRLKFSISSLVVGSCLMNIATGHIYNVLEMNGRTEYSSLC